MALTRVEAVVLKTHALGDTSRIAVLYSRERGMLRAVAKGARQPSSRFAGALEPLTRVSAMVYLKEGRELQLLSAADALESFARSDAGLERLTHAQAVVEFVDRLVWGEEAHEELYDLVLAALRRLAAAPEDALPAITLAFQLQAAALLGYRPVLDRCAACGRTEGVGRHFAPQRGGLVCRRCASQETMAVTLGPGAADELRRLAAHDLERDDPRPAARAGELLRIVEVHLQSHFQRFGGLRALELLRSLSPSLGERS